jgi:primosomal protein N' (replication factor Y) (superfamily II helicase)
VEFWVAVVVAAPAHSAIAQRLTYRSERLLAAGSLVRVPLGAREVLGIVWGEAAEPETDAQRAKTKGITAALEGIAPLDAAWRALLEFSGRYYQRGIGEVALAALPPQLRELDAEQLARRQQMQANKQAKLAKAAAKAAAQSAAQMSAHATVQEAPPVAALPATAAVSLIADSGESVQLSAQQSDVIAQFFADEAAQPALLFGTTGSGKTEVYLRCAARVLDGATNPTGGQPQVLVMVPEINLTPQLEARFMARFAPLYGAAAVVSMHSGMTPAQRLKSWLAAHTGQARIVLGTRMSIFASMPGLQLIIVDEEHDPSYKSQDGARHSARDLAVMRSKLQTAHAPPPAAGQGQTSAPCRVLLGSATPALETWHACQSGRYRLLRMPERVGGGALAALRLVDMRTLPKKTLFAPALLAAIQERIARGEQSLIFLNRRGYAPVLACGACDWKSDCPHCSAYRVFHKIDRTLRCHHCGTTDRVPRACPSCGNIDIAPIGRGTEKLEEQLAHALGIRTVVQAAPGTNEFTGMGMVADAPADNDSAELIRPDGRPAELLRPDGRAAVIARMDADTTRLKGSLEQQLAHVHSGDVDILVGTQMIAKGHDFRRITLVAAINPDSALYSSDFRAPERLFSLLMQAAGRAGRDASLQGAQMWLQTQHPDHPLFAALKAHDYESFADQQLSERTQAGLPPMSFQALIRAEAKSQDAAQEFLRTVSEAASGVAACEHVTLYPCVPMTIQRVANVERAQMLVESSSRAALQKFLSDWQGVLRTTKVQGLIRWAMDVDPLTI